MPYLAENCQNPRRDSLGTGAGVLLSGTSQLARRPTGTLDDNFTLPTSSLPFRALLGDENHAELEIML
jgi:hypothetical protein